MRTLRPKSITGGAGESGFLPALVEIARVVNVNVRDWSVDCVSEFGEKRFFDIQVSTPYLHFFNGEGFYVMPEVGATCWVCTPSSGEMAQPFVLAWGAPIDERDDPDVEAPAVNWRANRASLNPGDMMMRTRDENFLILRRGGVVQIGSTPIAQRFYVPIGNLIRDVCENYKMETLAGEMEYSVARTVEDVDGNQLTTFSIKSKLQANEPGHTAILRMGSHTDDDTLRLSLVVNQDGKNGSPTVAILTINNEGTVSWNVEKDWTQVVKGNYTLTVEEGNAVIEASVGTMDIVSKKAMALVTSDALSLTAAKTARLESTISATVKSPTIILDGMVAMGGTGGEPVVKGTKLVTLLTTIFTKLVSGDAGPGVVGPKQPFPGIASDVAKLQQVLSTKNTTT